MKVLKYLFSGVTAIFRTNLSSNNLPLLCGKMQKALYALSKLFPYHEVFNYQSIKLLLNNLFIVYKLYEAAIRWQMYKKELKQGCLREDNLREMFNYTCIGMTKNAELHYIRLTAVFSIMHRRMGVRAWIKKYPALHLIIKDIKPDILSKTLTFNGLPAERQGHEPPHQTPINQVFTIC